MRNAAPIIFSLLLFTGCASSEKIETEVLNKAEIEEVLIGHTYPIGGSNLENSKGAMYFLSNDTFEIVWEGQKGAGKWEAYNDGKFCYTNTLWSGRECITLLRNLTDGGFIHVFEGQQRMLGEGAIVSGRKI